MNPTTKTDSLFLRANLPKARSMRENEEDPSPGKQNATANAIAVRPPSISINEVPCSGVEDRTISELFASLVFSATARFGGSRSLRDLRIVLQRHFSSGRIEQMDIFAIYPYGALQNWL